MCVLKEKYKDQIILGCIIAVLGLGLIIGLSFTEIPVAFTAAIAVIILLIYLLVIIVKNFSDLEKLIKEKR